MGMLDEARAGNGKDWQRDVPGGDEPGRGSGS